MASTLSRRYQSTNRRLQAQTLTAERTDVAL
jgi:hypothetical protein